MSINVVSTTEPVAEAPKAEATQAPEVKQSAPETKETLSGETTEDSEATETLEAKADDHDEESESKDEGDESDEDRPKKTNGFKKRIDKLNKRLNDHKREMEYWKAEALKQAKQETKPVESRKETAPQPDGKPIAENFETHAEFVEALTDWKVEQKEKAKEIQARETEAKSAYQKQVDAHVKRVEEFKEKHEDFDEVLESVDDVRISVAVEQAILDSDLGAHLMYELAKDKKEFKRICSLSPIAAAREIGRVEARLAATASDEKPEIKEVKKPKAPPPISPVGSKAASARRSIFDADKMSQKEYEAMRRQQMRDEA